MKRSAYLKLIFACWLAATGTSALGGVQLPAQTISAIDTGWGYDGIYIATEEQLMGDECSGNKVLILATNPFFDQILSIALSAMHAEKKVRFYVDGCSSNGSMLLLAIRIEG